MQPQTTLERAYAICCMIVGASVYAYMVGAVCGIVASMDPDNREFYGNMDTYVCQSASSAPAAIAVTPVFSW